MISNDDIVDSLDNNSVATEGLGGQIKLTDMIAKMKAPSKTKKVDLVTLKGKIDNPNDKDNNISEPSKTMTQQMIDLLDKVEAKNANSGNLVNEKAQKTNPGEDRKNDNEIQVVVGKKIDFIDNKDEKCFTCW